MTDIPGDSSTTASLNVGDTVIGTIDTGGDHDWFAVQLVAGQKYTLTLDGYGANALVDPYLYLHDSSGTVVASNDDSGGGHNSRIVFTATQTGTYYVDASAWDDANHTYGYTGDYQLSVQTFSQPVYTDAQIADQLVNGYWGGDWHHFNVTQGGTITVNITALTSAGQTLARAALNEWSDVIGVTFKEVTTGGQIVFDDSQDGAATSSDWSNHVITSSSVNISTQWLTDYGTGLNSYSFQTYIHEIGHALGLGHSGDYNETATFSDDALFANDAWSTSVMSYFSPQESPYFNNQNYSYDFDLTPMSADILAMKTLYGLSTTTRTGDTTYGYNSNADRAIFNASIYPDAAYTIIDNGGTDTLNFGATSSPELINLNPMTFSNVAGSTGNLSIAVGTVIENATSGSGNDTIVGNAANNVLNGGAGTDTVSYEAATAGVTVDMRTSAQQNTVGAGQDTLIGFENLIGSSHGDALIAASNTATVHGGDGNDVITAGGGSGQIYYGDTGDDSLVASSGNDSWFGGDGYDTIDYSRAAAAITATTNTANNQTGGSGTDSLSSVERVIGSAYADTLTALYAGDEVDGGAGNDTLKGLSTGAILAGGTGDDTYLVPAASTDPYAGAAVGLSPPAVPIIVEAAGQGTDLVQAGITFTLSANVENLTLTGTDATDGTGNASANIITGNAAANALSGMAGDDTLYAGAGNDTLDGGAGNDRMYGGTGDDTYIVRDATDYAYENAGEGTDTVLAYVNASLRANVENLTLEGTAGLSGKGNDAANVITGNSGANALYGYGGDDTLIGGDGRDILDGGTGNDVMQGGAGNDVYVVDSTSDTIVENAGEGTDFVRASVSYTLAANVDRLYETGSANIDATGNADQNLLVGNAGANHLSGMGANDHLYGGAGNDILDGGSGNDDLEGGAGRDTLIGGDGSDFFVFRDGDSGATMTSADEIQDFALGDRLDLAPIDANTAAGGNQSFTFIGTHAFDGTAGELRYQQVSGDTYLSGDTNGDGIADFMVKIDGLHTVTSSDLML